MTRHDLPRLTTPWLRRTLVACTVFTAATATAAASWPSLPETADARVSTVSDADLDVLLEWNTIAQVETIAIRPTAHGQARGIAMVQGAVYDAVNAIDRGRQPYLLDVDALDIRPRASYDAAIATAAHDVLVGIVDASKVPALNAAYLATLQGIQDGWKKEEGVRAGSAAAVEMLSARADDGFRDPFDFVIGSDPGDWRPVTPQALDPDPWVSQLTPFLMDSPSQFRSTGPDPLTSKAYARDFREVKRVGSLTSKARTADQTTAAIFWQWPPVALWNGVFRDLSRSEGLDVAEAARLFASTNLAAADGATACWNEKYYWNFWRPMAAVREADTDGNRATVADPSWTPLYDPSTATVPPLANPPFPDYPSGHGCVSGAVLHTARTFFGTDRIGFEVHSGRFPGQPRHFRSFSRALDEVVDSRVWGGIHFRKADEAGAEIGRQVARWLDDHYFQPTTD